MSQAPAAVVSAALSVVRQLPSAHPQVDRAACRMEVLPIDEPPRKWKPPDSWPARCSSGPAKLAAMRKGEAAVAHGRRRHVPLPIRQAAGNRELRRSAGLQDDGLAARAEGAIRQHEP